MIVWLVQGPKEEANQPSPHQLNHPLDRNQIRNDGRDRIRSNPIYQPMDDVRTYNKRPSL